MDGYNVINSWQDFRKFREENLEHARELLKEKLAEYTAFKGYSGIVVFDAQEVQGVASFEKNGALEIVFTNEGETADSWIERRVYDLVKSGSSVFVVTSDYAEQLNVLGSGAYRISAREFREEYLLTKKQIAQYLKIDADITMEYNEKADRCRKFLGNGGCANEYGNAI